MFSSISTLKTGSGPIVELKSLGKHNGSLPRRLQGFKQTATFYLSTRLHVDASPLPIRRKSLRRAGMSMFETIIFFTLNLLLVIGAVAPGVNGNLRRNKRYLVNPNAGPSRAQVPFLCSIPDE